MQQSLDVIVRKFETVGKDWMQNELIAYSTLRRNYHSAVSIVTRYEAIASSLFYSPAKGTRSREIGSQTGVGRYSAAPYPRRIGGARFAGPLRDDDYQPTASPSLRKSDPER